MPDALETRLTRAGERLPEPPGDATARARAAALAALPAPPRRAPWRRPLGIAAALAGVAALAGLVVALIVVTPGRDDGPPAPASLRPDVTAVGTVTACADPPANLAIRCVEGTQAVRDATEGLAGAPWLTRYTYDTSARPSLVFPPGTTYAEALDALVVNVTLTGGLPPGTSLGPPLPGRAVLLAHPTDPSQGIAISLAAPFGYLASGRPATPTFEGDETDVASEGLVWPVPTRVSVPKLPACMIIDDRSAPPPADCSPTDGPYLGGQRAPELPSVPIRSAPVDLTLPRLDGSGPVSLTSLRGQVVILSAFASWCAPCADQARPFRALAARYGGDADVATVGVAVNDLTAEAARFLRDQRLGFGTVLADRDGDAMAALQVNAVPETLVLDREGRIAFRLAGPLVEPATVERGVEALR